MAIETFRYIEYSNEDLFENKEGRIELTEYAKDLVFYSSFDTLTDANFFEASKTAVKNNATIENWGVFGQHVLLSNGSLSYHEDNFQSLSERGSIQFRVKPNFSHDYGYQNFLAKDSVSIPVFPRIQALHSRFGGASLDLSGGYGKHLTYSANNVSQLVQKGTITFFFKCGYTGTPDESVNFLSIGDETDNNKIDIRHKDTGELSARIFSQTGTLISELSFSWFANTGWNELTLCFNTTTGSNKFFLNGVMHSVSSSTGTREQPTGSVMVGGANTDIYMDDLAVFSEPLYTNDYAIRTSSIKSDRENLLLLASYDTGYNLNFGSHPLMVSLAPVNNTYGFKITVEKNSLSGPTYDEVNVSIVLQESDTLQDIVDKIHNEINGTDASVSLTDGQIRISSSLKGNKVQIGNTTGVSSLIDVLEGVGESLYPNSPTSSVRLIDLYNGTNNSNRMSLIHTDSSHLQLVMYDNGGTKKVDKDLGIWNNETYSWYAFEISWNRTMAEVFIDGQLVEAVKTGFSRGTGTKLILNSTLDSYYGFDELIAYNVQKNKEEYDIPQYALTPYATSDPYVDVFFGSGFREHEVVDFTLNCSSNVYFSVKIGNKWFYHYSGDWRTSNATFQQSSSASTMETKFSDLLFEEELNVVVRAFFHSDGFTPAWLDEIAIITEIGEAQPAFITGTFNLSGTVDLSSNYNVVITTSDESKEVDLSSEAVDKSAVSMEEIKAAINNANIKGLAPVSDDGKGHLILRTSETGKNSFINISEGTIDNALDLVWGFEDSDFGEQATGQYFDYSEMYRWIRASLGAPTVPVELTDEQLQDCVAPAVYWYNYYRNAKENTIYITLDGNVRDGFTIPQEVGGEDNIIEIIMRPRFPYIFYAGKTDLLAHVYAQWFFMQHQRSLNHMAGDYYLTMSTQKDLENIMGTELKWHFYNGRLFITPPPPRGMEVGIRFRSAVSLNEINTNIFIRNYALGKAKTILGTVRSTFGGSIPGGSEMLTLRGESLIAEGKEEMERVIVEMQKLSEPLGFEWG